MFGITSLAKKLGGKIKQGAKAGLKNVKEGRGLMGDRTSGLSSFRDWQNTRKQNRAGAAPAPQAAPQPQAPDPFAPQNLNLPAAPGGGFMKQAAPPPPPMGGGPFGAPLPPPMTQGGGFSAPRLDLGPLGGAQRPNPWQGRM